MTLDCGDATQSKASNAQSIRCGDVIVSHSVGRSLMQMNRRTTTNKTTNVFPPLCDSTRPTSGSRNLVGEIFVVDTTHFTVEMKKINTSLFSSTDQKQFETRRQRERLNFNFIFVSSFFSVFSCFRRKINGVWNYRNTAQHIQIS